MGAQPQAAVSTREITVLAQDPSISAGNGKPLVTQVRIPNEEFLAGPRGSRFEVIDYDAATGTFYTPFDLLSGARLEKASTAELLDHPGFHAQNVFGIAAATLFEFERSLGRSLSWGFGGESHQLKLVPHAFREANAFYSRDDEAVLFGYFKGGKANANVFTCLSHDIVAHETTHAILDGMRNQYVRPSSNQQGAFHEGFADIVALLSVLRSEQLILFALKKSGIAEDPTDRVSLNKALKAIRESSILFGLAEEMGAATDKTGRNSLKGLRRSIEKKPDGASVFDPQAEVHELGEVLVAAVMQAYAAVWRQRLDRKFERSVASGGRSERQVDAWRIAEEGAKAAQHLLTMVIRAIDYLPPVHLQFHDFLMAVITSDWQTCPDDSTYNYRGLLLETFASWGIKPLPGKSATITGAFDLFDKDLRYGRGNSDALRWDRDGMFKFIWQNQAELKLAADVYTKVDSVRSVWRVAPDGFIVHETVAEYYQLEKRANIESLKRLDIPVPLFVRRNDKTRFDLVGGGTLIFDEFGTLKFHIRNRLGSRQQHDRLSHLNFIGQLVSEAKPRQPFALDHAKRSGFARQVIPSGECF
jgi:hypothetical protein